MSTSLLKPNIFSALKDLLVLVVDHNVDNLVLLRAILEEYEVRVTTARSVGEALQAIARIKPDILISDILIPVEDGYSLIRQIRNLETKQERQLPAIALTAAILEEGSTLALNAGFQMYETKPINFDKLLTAMVRFATAR
ncbi:MAG: response regulator [Cyanobacteriota bacterium]